MPRGIDENKISWSKGEGLDSKYLYVCHAEMNAILNIRDGTRLRDTILYVTLYPCNECAKAIIQTGISEVVYLENKYAGTTMTKASALLFELAHIKVRKYAGELIDVILK
jgi:dCMP deaminase